MRKNYLLLTVISAFCLIGCEDREPLSWESDIFLPILDDRIGWLEFAEDTVDIIVTEGEAARLVLSQPIDMISGKLAPVLPDTSLEENIGIGNIPVAIPVPTDYPFIVQEEELPITNLGGSAGAYLREVVVSSGEMVFAVENTIEGILELSYYLTCCTIDGEQVGIDLVVPPAVDGELGVATGSLSLENAVFDLTGLNGVGNNLITTSFTAQGSQDNEDIFYATSADNIKVTVQFHDFTVKTALGYFGNLSAGFSAEEWVTDTLPLPNPILEMDGAVAKLQLENTIGADVRFAFDSLTFDGIQLDHPTFYGTHDMARAQWINDELYSTTHLEIDLTEEGSTLNELIEMMPEHLKTVGNIELNPYGDVSLGNDYLDADVPPNLDLLLEVPLNVGFDGLILEDSFDIEAFADMPKFDGSLHVDFYSTFPVQVNSNLVYTANDSTETVISRDVVIDPVNNLLDQPGHGYVEIPVNQSLVENSRKIDETVYVSTEGAVTFYGDEDVRVQVRIEGTQLIEE